jgi:putative component of membrane protein insertase Oxa1/YidC/SpoIIIJ protein YidD
MAALSLESGVSQLALLGIRGYRKYISPYKGFRCAHHALHDQGSCSTFGLQAFQENRPLEAWRKLRGRFVECRLAYEALMRETKEEREERKRKKRTERREQYSEYCMPLEACPPSDCAMVDFTPDKSCDMPDVSCEVGTCDIGSCS